MNLTDLSSVVIQKRDDSIFKRRFDHDLFVYFALDAGAVGLARPMPRTILHFTHVATDPDRPFATSRCSPAFFPRT